MQCEWEQYFAKPLLLRLVSITICIYYLRFELFKILGICGIIVFSLALIENIFFILDKRPVIEKNEQLITFRNGFRRTTININDIVEISQNFNNTKKVITKDSIYIKANIEGKEKIIICKNIINATDVIDKLNNFIKVG